MKLEETSCVICGENKHAPFANGLDYEYETSPNVFNIVRCQKCAHVYLNPRPTIDSAELMYPREYYTFSQRTSLFQKIKDAVVTRRLKWCLKRLPIGARVMEVGCGDGKTLIALRRKRPDLQIVGLDLQFSKEQSEYFKQHNIEIIESPLERAKLKANSYDLILMNQLIEHLWDVRGCMEKTRFALKPGGLLSISTPNLDGYDRKLFSKSLWGGYHMPRHLNIFTRKSLEVFLGQYGLKRAKFTHLTAPLIWVTTVHNGLKIRNFNAHKWFGYGNLPALTVFTILDIVMKTIGFSTSNQQIIVKKA